jgi:hypothetical protein
MADRRAGRRSAEQYVGNTAMDERRTLVVLGWILCSVVMSVFVLNAVTMP